MAEQAQTEKPLEKTEKPQVQKTQVQPEQAPRLSGKEFTIPLRRDFLKAPRYERSRIAVRTIKRYIARHMKVPLRNLSRVKLDVFFNNEIWFRGNKKPPAKIKVRAFKDGENTRVVLAEMPEEIRFRKSKVERRHKMPEKPKEKKEEKPESEVEKKAEELRSQEKTEEEKKDEKEKEKSVAEHRAKQAEIQAKAQKHIVKEKKGHQLGKSTQRKALKK